MTTGCACAMNGMHFLQERSGAARLILNVDLSCVTSRNTLLGRFQAGVLLGWFAGGYQPRQHPHPQYTTGPLQKQYNTGKLHKYIEHLLQCPLHDAAILHPAAPISNFQSQLAVTHRYKCWWQIQSDALSVAGADTRAKPYVTPLWSI